MKTRGVRKVGEVREVQRGKKDMKAREIRKHGRQGI